MDLVSVVLQISYKIESNAHVRANWLCPFNYAEKIYKTFSAVQNHDVSPRVPSFTFHKISKNC